MSARPDTNSFAPGLPPSRTPSVPRSAVAGAILDCVGAPARASHRGRDGETVLNRTKKLTKEFGARGYLVCQGRNLHEEVGVIDRSKPRDIPTLPAAQETASLFGARGADTNSVASLAGVKTVHMIASDPITKSLASRGPSTYGSAAILAATIVRHEIAGWKPAVPGRTCCPLRPEIRWIPRRRTA